MFLLELWGANMQKVFGVKGKVSKPTKTNHILMWFKYEEIKGKMFAEMQNWALEQCVKKWKEQ